jgi:hypothetical protein
VAVPGAAEEVTEDEDEDTVPEVEEDAEEDVAGDDDVEKAA